MANDSHVKAVTSGQVSSLAVGLLSRSLVLPNTVAKIPGGEFEGPNGSTVTVRVPQPGKSHEQENRSDEISFDSIEEDSVDVKLKHLYNATNVTDQDLTLDIEDFGAQVTKVQIDAVARGAEDEIADEMNDLDAMDDTIDDDGSNVDKMVLKARQKLGEKNVPSGDRYLAVSPEVASFLLTCDKFVRVDASGDDSALRDAEIGKIFGFKVVESNALDSGTALAYHKTSFAFANRVPKTPKGAAESSSEESGGVGLRHIFQYMPNRLQDASVLSTFAGAKVVDEDRVVRIKTDDES